LRGFGEINSEQFVKPHTLESVGSQSRAKLLGDLLTLGAASVSLDAFNKFEADRGGCHDSAAVDSPPNAVDQL
jgi:hypothetical protein